MGAETPDQAAGVATTVGFFGPAALAPLLLFTRVMGTGLGSTASRAAAATGGRTRWAWLAIALGLTQAACAGAPDDTFDGPRLTTPDAGPADDPGPDPDDGPTCGDAEVVCGDTCCAAPPANGESIELSDIAEGQIVADSRGAPHVAYRAKNGEVRYGVWNAESSAWKLTRVDGGGGYGVSIALDSLDRPHICFTRGPSNTASEMRYVSFDGATWKALAFLNVTGRCAIGISAGTAPNLLYRSGASLIYTRRGANGWTPTAIPNLGASVFAMRIDAANSAHIAYVEGSGTNAKIKYVSTKDTKKVLTVAESKGDTLDRMELSLDANNAPGVLFTRTNASRRSLVFASLGGETWTEQSVMQSLTAQDYIGMGVDSRGGTHVVVTSPAHAIEIHRRVAGAWQWVDATADSVTSPIASITGDRFGRTHVLAQGDGTFYLSFDP